MKKTALGFAMIEVLVTAAIVAIGVSGMGVLLLRSLQGTQDNAQQSQAMWIVQDYAGRIRANSLAARNGDYELAAQPDCAAPPANICLDHRTNNSFIQSSNCTVPADMAEMDRWITMCGLDGGLKDASADFLADAELSSTCLDVSALNGNCLRYLISLTWSTRLQQGNADENLRDYDNEYSMVVEVN